MVWKRINLLKRGRTLNFSVSFHRNGLRFLPCSSVRWKPAEGSRVTGELGGVLCPLHRHGVRVDNLLARSAISVLQLHVSAGCPAWIGQESADEAGEALLHKELQRLNASAERRQMKGLGAEWSSSSGLFRLNCSQSMTHSAPSELIHLAKCLALQTLFTSLRPPHGCH